MTEEEWLAATDLPQLIKSQRDTGKDRKLRLFACACLRTAWDQLSDGLGRVAVDVSERFADDAAGADELDRVYRATEQEWSAGGRMARIVSTGMAAVFSDAAWAALHASSHSPAVAVAVGTPSRRRAMAAHRQSHLALFRCVIGNPFRPVVLDPSWLSSPVLALARSLYDSRDFSPLPILADALQEAGCDSEAVLDHCRGSGPHVRGCWVVDLLLGKS